MSGQSGGNFDSCGLPYFFSVPMQGYNCKLWALNMPKLRPIAEFFCVFTVVGIVFSKLLIINFGCMALQLAARKKRIHPVNMLSR